MLDTKRFRQVSRCRIIQKQFTAAHSTTIVHGMDLDHAIDFGSDVGHMTLQQVRLGMKAKQDWPLFVSIDLDTYRNKIVTVIHNDTLSEASNILSFLPLFLETRLGDQIWKWLPSAYQAEMSSFFWDEDAQRVVSIDGSKDDSDSPSSENTSNPWQHGKLWMTTRWIKHRLPIPLICPPSSILPRGMETVLDQATMTKCHLPPLQPVPPSSP